MKLQGYRQDGAVRVLIPGGITFVLRDGLSSPPLDDQQADRLGPWERVPQDLWLFTDEDQREVQTLLNHARVVPTSTLVMLWDESAHPRDDAGKFGEGGGGGDSKGDSGGKSDGGGKGIFEGVGFGEKKYSSGVEVTRNWGIV